MFPVPLKLLQTLKSHIFCGFIMVHSLLIYASCFEETSVHLRWVKLMNFIIMTDNNAHVSFKQTVMRSHWGLHCLPMNHLMSKLIFHRFHKMFDKMH